MAHFLVSRLVALTVGLSLFALPGVAQTPPTAAAAPPPVRLMTVPDPGQTLRREFYGQVVARQTVDLAFQVGGQLVEFPVENGQRVRQGALLARLDLANFERAVRRAELEREQAQRDFARAAQLAESNVTTQARFDDARTALDLAEVALEEAREALADATLRAQFDGLVARRLVANYSTVAQGTPVLRLHDMSEPRVEIAVPERLFRRAGNLAGLAFTAALGGGLPEVTLDLAEFTAETEGLSQSYTVDLALPEVAGYRPIPGRTVTVVARLGQPDDATLRLPATALVTGADGSTRVMAFVPDTEGGDTGTVMPVPVSVTTREGAEIAVAADGALAPGREIVATGGHLLQPGDAVRRFTGFGEAG